VSESEITCIAHTLAKDTEAVKKKYDIYKSLELPHEELKEWIQKMLFDVSYDVEMFFTDILTEFKKSKWAEANVQNLGNLFLQLGLNNVVGKIFWANLSISTLANTAAVHLYD